MILRMNISIFQVVSEALMTLREHKSLLLRRIQKMKSTFLLWKVDPMEVSKLGVTLGFRKLQKKFRKVLKRLL